MSKKEEKKEDTAGQAEKVEEEVWRIPKSPAPLTEIEKHMNNIIVGERNNKLLLFLLLLSGKKWLSDKDRQFILLRGESGAGKTKLASISELFKTKKVGRFTEHALDYSDLGAYEILYLQELGDMDNGEKTGLSTIKFQVQRTKDTM